MVSYSCGSRTISQQLCVVLNGESSDLLKATSGVPQGSICRRLLFIIFMNSLTSVILSSESQLALNSFMQMTSYKPTSSAVEVSKLQSDIYTISRAHWHGLKLNTAKTHLMLITQSRSPFPINITHNGSPILVSKILLSTLIGVTLSSCRPNLELTYF